MSPVYKDISDDVILITGAGNGIGREMCLEFAKYSSNILALDIDEKGLQETAVYVKSGRGVQIKPYLCDLSSPADIDRIVNEILQDYGRVTILVNNAAIINLLPLLHLSVDKFDKCFKVNFYAYFYFYQYLSEKLGISDEMMMLGVFTNKILTNLKYWSNCEAVLQRTLNLLSELSMGFSAMRKLLRLDDIQFMLVNHTPEYFPFLLSTTNTAIPQSSTISRLRTTFYASLSRLLMVDLGEDEEQFLNFVSPLTRVTNQLIIALLSGDPSNLSQELTKISIIGLARDVRGISCSLNTKTSYQMLIDWIYPSGLQLFNRALDLWPLDHNISVPIFKTLTELVHNRNGRLLYDTTIPIAYLLFTHVSKLLYNFDPENPKVIEKAEEVVRAALLKLSNHNVADTKMQLLPLQNHSVLNNNSSPKISSARVQLLQLQALQKKIAEQSALLNEERTIDPEVLTQIHILMSELTRRAEVAAAQLADKENADEDLNVIDPNLLARIQSMDHTKLALCHFGLLEHMFNEHIIFVASLGTPILLHFLKTIASNLTSLDPGISEVCCVCLDSFLTHLFKLVQRQQRFSRINTANNSSNSNNNNNSLYLLNLNGDNNSNNSNSNINNNSNVMKPNDNSNNELLMSHLILGKGGASNHAVWSSRATLASTNLLNLLVMNNATTTTTVTGNLESLEMQSGVTLLRRILILLLSSVMQEDCRCQWSMSRPLLPLILLNQQYYAELRNCVITGLPLDRQESVTKLFDKLMEDVECNVTLKNRDK
uniref:Uncharacterized protein n=1 Tax=Trichobilharzia regenti TaxID=157069 RepID=A0AA85KCE1_TRIRE|nr:unnamed protein product [Trichobilharzia regenti]